MHRYETVSVEHRTKIGYFAGLRSLQAFRVNYLADDDTDRYIDHLLDDQNITSIEGIGFDSDSHLVGQGAGGPGGLLLRVDGVAGHGPRIRQAAAGAGRRRRISWRTEP